MSFKSLDNKINIKIKAFKNFNNKIINRNRNRNKGNIKTKLVDKNKDIIRDVYLPLTLDDSKNGHRTYKEIKNNQNFLKNFSYSKYLLSLREIRNMKKNKIFLSGNINTNTYNNNNVTRTNNNHISTFHNSNKQLLTYNKNNKNKITEFNSKYYSNNDIENNKTNTKEREENIIKLGPIIQKKSLRNIICEKKYHENEMKKLLYNKSEKNDNEITKKNKEDKLTIFLKHKTNNMIERNFSNHVNKYDTFNKSPDSSIILDRLNDKNIKDNSSSKKIEKKNYERKKFFQNNIRKNDTITNDINKIKNNDYFKTYFLNKKFSQERRKKINEDIIQILNVNE